MTTLFQSLYTLTFIAADRVVTRMETVKQEKGASAVEYALLVAAVAAAIGAAVLVLKPKLSGLFNSLTVPN